MGLMVDTNVFIKFEKSSNAVVLLALKPLLLKDQLGTRIASSFLSRL